MAYRLVILLCLVAFSGDLLGKRQSEWQDVGRIVAVGDLHGDYEQYIRILKMNGLIDDRLNWTGGNTHLVQVGDIPDRGPDSLKIIEHVQELERQAIRSGGYVHPLIGNHEAMNVEGDLRYVHPGEYEVLVTRKSKRLQQNWLKRVYDYRLQLDPTIEERENEVMQALAEEFPLGYVEHRKLWEPGQKVARWVATNNTVIKINDVLFVHAGIDPHQPLMAIDEINTRVRTTLSGPDARLDNFANAENSPLWYRGLAMNKADVELEPLIRMLEFYDANHIIIAHTPTNGDLVSRFDGRVVIVDVGISRFYGSNTANLLIDGQQFLSVKPEGATPLELPNQSDQAISED